MEKAKENATEPPRLSRLPRFRKIRVFFYVFLVLVALIVIPATLLPPWLATKGIEINAISGISIGKRITIDELAISINSNTITINQLVLERFVDAESAISDASWRLSSPETTIRLAPSIRQATYHQGVKLGDIHLHNVAFNLTDLSPPYVFSAKAELASMFLKSKSAQPITQQIHDLSLVLTTEPYVALTGDFNQAKLTAFHPADVHTYQYPIDISKTHFSISWQPYNTPLNIHINRLNPKWASVTNPFEQLGENVTFSADLSQMKNSIKLTADTLALDQPVSLPEFIDKPDDEHEGLHLGRAIANLAQLPLQKVKIKHFSYGELIINSKLVIETPRVRMNKPNKPAKLHLKGQALGPDPYGIDVLVKHTGELDAHFTGTMTDPNGNSIHCAANVNFANPLPKALTCGADLEHTQDLTNKLKLFDMPHAKLTKPIVLEAKQTHLILSEKVTQTTKDKGAVSDQGATKQQEQAQAQPIKPHYQYQDVIKAGYKIDITLPESLKVNLNRYAFDRPKILASDKAISSIELNTDGTLSLMALYENDTIRIKLSDNTIAGSAAEKLTFANQQINSRLSTQFSQLNCQIPFSLKGRKAKLKQPVKPKRKASRPVPPNGLHCHAKLIIDSAIGALYPTPTLSLSQISAKTALILDWTEKALQAELSNLDIKVDSAQISLDGNWVETKADNLQVIAKRIEVRQQYHEEATQAFSLRVGQSPISVMASLSAQQLITDESESANRPRRQSKNSASLPVQKYQSKFSLALTDSVLSIEHPKLPDSSEKTSPTVSLSSNYKVATSLTQNNQALPAIFTSGSLNYNGNTVSLSGNTTNKRDISLLPYSITYNIQSQNADISLHRNDIVFTSKKTLKKYYLPRLPTEYDLNSGKISFDAKLSLRNNQWSGKLGVFTDSLSGYIHDIHFADVNVALTAKITPSGFRSIHPISFHAGYLHAGILLENLFTTLEFDTGASRYAMHRVSAYSLGGSISIHDIQTSSLSHIPTTPVIIHGLNLTNLIESVDLKDIHAEGILDGTLPLAFLDGFPVITNGTLHSRYPGGVLKYKEGSKIDQNIESAGDSSLATISKILKNYNYHALAVDLDYSKEGQLIMSSRFKGHNPDFLKGQPINLNLTIQENIPALLKTLSVINSSKLESMFLKQLGIDE